MRGEKAGCSREISKRGLLVGVLPSQPNRIFYYYNINHMIYVLIIIFF